MSNRLLARVDQHRSRILCHQAHQRGLLDVHDTTERAPPGRAELVALDVPVASLDQLVREALAPAAVEPVAVEDDLRRPVGDGALDLGDVGDVQRGGGTRLPGYRARTRNVADRELVE